METELAGIVRERLAATAAAVREVPMFGGIGFMLNGNLLAGASARGLLLRVGRERAGEALGRPGARPMVMRGRTLEGYVYVDPPALSPEAVRGWIELALPYVRALPAKAAKRRRPKPARTVRPAAAARPKQQPAPKRAAAQARGTPPARPRARGK
ncbi:MAG TPA: TfoX/Sxy family protein [Steroidobacteraceae bacterium]|nr:TfoX/Sxy family protein [Steroidobacteraceae bacterium]